MKFNYQARTKQGRVQSGIIESSSREAALMLLQKYGLYVTFLEEAEAKPFFAKEIVIFRRVSNKEKVLFTRQLSILLKTGTSPVEALKALAKQTNNSHFKEKILEISSEIEGGSTLSQSFSRFPELFSPFYINMLKSGEISGNLSESLIYLANHLEREYNLTGKIKGAMIYPILVLTVVLFVVIAMMIFVVPQLSKVLKEAGAELPPLTKVVIAFSDFFVKWWVILILVFFGLLIFIFRYLKTKRGKRFFDEILLKIPLIGPLSKKIYLSRFAENLSTLISGGLPIAQALEVTGNVVGNTVYKEIIFEVRDKVKKGNPISSVLKKYPKIISPLFVQMTVVGEKSGQLDKTLTNIVNFYQSEVDRTIDNAVSLLEPILIIILGVVVAILVGAVLMPIYQIGMVM